MVINTFFPIRCPFFFIGVLLFLLPPCPIFADTEPVFVQRLEWSAVSYAHEYRVAIEKLYADGTWTGVEELETEKTFIDRSFSSGKYRFRVQVVNLFSKTEGHSDWKEFEILHAIKPFFSQTTAVINFALKTSTVFSGGNMAQNARIFLVHTQTNEQIPIPTATVSPDGKSLSLSFEGFSKKQKGVYKLIVENPGGLTATLSLSLAYKPRIWSFSAGYAPFVFPTEKSLGGSFFNKIFFLSGVALTFESLPFETGWGRLGFALSVQGGYLVNEDSVGNILEDLYVNPKVSAHLGTTQLEFVYECPLVPRRFFLRIKAGAGISAIVNFKVETEDAGLLDVPFIGIMPSFSAGLSLRYVFSSGVFISAGADYIYLIDKQIDGHSLIPQIGFGVRW